MDISIIIVSYNTKKVLSNCIQSIYKYSKGFSFEIIVVDNGSTDGSRESLAKLARQKKIILINSPQNKGFGAANNLGAKRAKAEYLLFLNPDTLLVSNSLLLALNWLKKHPKVGAMTVKLLNSDRTVQPTGGHFPTLFRVFIWQLFLEDLPFLSSAFKSIHPHEPGFFFFNRLTKKQFFSFKNNSIYDHIYFPDWITGAFVFMSASIFKKAGGFDDKIFMYVEETELCFRIKKLNKKIAYVPLDSIIHLSRASSSSTNALVWEAVNMVYFFNKHYSALLSFLVRVIIIVGSVLRLLIFGYLGNNKNKRKAYVQIIQKLI